MPRVRALLLALVGLGTVGAGSALGAGADQAAGTFDVTPGGTVLVALSCAQDTGPCSGAVTLTSVASLAVERGGERTKRTIARGDYGELAPGQRKVVPLRLTQHTWAYVLARRETRASIAFDPPAAAPASPGIAPLPKVVTLRRK